MKTKNVQSTLLFALVLAFSFCSQAQDRDTMSKSEISKMDSVDTATLRANQIQKANDENRLNEAKLDRKQTRAKSKDARRFEKEASNAARESKVAVRTERKAQKSRKEATKQAKRASDARAKSDKNQ